MRFQVLQSFPLSLQAALLGYAVLPAAGCILHLMIPGVLNSLLWGSRQPLLFFNPSSPSSLLRPCCSKKGEEDAVPLTDRGVGTYEPEGLGKHKENNSHHLIFDVFGR